MPFLYKHVVSPTATKYDAESQAFALLKTQTTILTQESRVEPNSKLANQITCLRRAGIIQFREKFASAWFSDGSEILDKIFLSHSNASVCNVQQVIVFVGLYLYCQFFDSRKRILISKRKESDFVQSIRGVGDEFPQENLSIERKLDNFTDHGWIKLKHEKMQSNWPPPVVYIHGRHMWVIACNDIS